VAIHVSRWGTGPPVVLVHGAMANGDATWQRQQPLAERWTLVVPTRQGFVPNPPLPPKDGSDYEVEAGDVAALLGDGAHLVGHSYGGLVAMFAAAQRPEAVRSLCLLEPAAQALRRGDPDVEAGILEHERRRDTITEPREFLVAFSSAIGAPADAVPDPLPPDLERHVLLLMHERAPYGADIPVAALAAGPYPKLVVSGGHNEHQEQVCDTTAAAIGAERACLPGRGHLVSRAPGFNDLVEQFWRRAG
jgi:pimeloyl-ACP methyl ester carboxylesterase